MVDWRQWYGRKLGLMEDQAIAKKNWRGFIFNFNFYFLFFLEASRVDIEDW